MRGRSLKGRGAVTVPQGGGGGSGSPPNYVITFNIGGTPNGTGGWTGGTDYTIDFNQGATYHGTYDGEFVHQQFWSKTHPSIPYWIFWARPDVGSARHEVVFEYATNIRVVQSLVAPRASAPGSFLTGIINAKIFINGAQQTGGFVMNTPQGASGMTGYKHWSYARWRWVSALRPIVRNVATIQSRNWLPPLGLTIINGAIAPPAQATATPMARCGLRSYWGGGGDDEQIGPVTAWQAHYILTGDANSLSALMSQAECSGSVRSHYRDGNANLRPIDPEQLWQYSVDFPNYPNDIPNWSLEDATNQMQQDTTHAPPLVFIPWALTDDPYYVEYAQFAISYYYVDGTGWRLTNRGRLNMVEVRSWGWGLRELMYAAFMTPTSIPNCMLPKSQYETYLQQNRTDIQRWLDSPAKPHAYFHFLIYSDEAKDWEHMYVRSSLFWLWKSGYSATLGQNWEQVLDFSLAEALYLSDGVSGWDIRASAPYVYNIWNGHTDPETQGVGPYSGFQATTANDSHFYASWAEALVGFLNDPGRGALVPGQLASGNAYYAPLYRASLAMAVHRKRAGSTNYNIYQADSIWTNWQPYFNEWKNRFSYPVGSTTVWQYAYDPPP